MSSLHTSLFPAKSADLTCLMPSIDQDKYLFVYVTGSHGLQLPLSVPLIVWQKESKHNRKIGKYSFFEEDVFQNIKKSSWATKI